jgi:hypothetical protein
MVEEGFRKFFPPVPASMYVIREKVWVVCAKQREGKLCNIDPFSLQQMYHSVCHIRKKTGGWKFYQSTNSTRGRKRVEFQQSQKGCKVWITHKINVPIFWSFNFSLLLLGC